MTGFDSDYRAFSDSRKKVMTAAVAMIVLFAGSAVLMNGEIVGKPTDVPWAFLFDGYDEPRHPAQLYEALTYLILGLAMLWIYRYRPYKVYRGFYFGFFLVGCFGMRFLIEFIKEPQVGFEENMVLNMGQLLSIPFVLLGIAALVFSFSKKIPSRIGRQR